MGNKAFETTKAMGDPAPKTTKQKVLEILVPVGKGLAIAGGTLLAAFGIRKIRKTSSKVSDEPTGRKARIPL